jgi:uncharacterized membrane protein/plastocyanin
VESYLIDWLGLALRWAHVVAAIAWIGHAFFFHSIHQHMRHDRHPERPEVEGDLWMIHGGGFYYMQRASRIPASVIPELLWFKWEAGLTWLSGFFLLIVVFYLGGGVYLVDPAVAALGSAQAIGLGIASIVVGWLVYDGIWASPIGRNPRVAAGLSLVSLVALVAALTHTLAGRAAYIHVGGVLATCMAANVWMRIIPGQRKMLAEIAAGREPDPELTRRTQWRSVSNGYMQFPVIFVMISNHYPATYGHPHNAVVLLLVMALGAAIRQLLFDAGKSPPAVYAGVAATVVPLAVLTAPFDWPAAEPATATPSAVIGEAIDPAQTGEIRGTVRLDGAPPPPRELVLSGCLTDGPVWDDAVVVADGKLANALVWIRQGAERWQAPPPPADEVVVDQKGCMYAPKVVGVRAGQPVAFLNSDDVVHNVRTVPSANPATNDVMPARDLRAVRTFKRPEVAIQTKCDVHPWMTAHVGVFDHPWFAVTAADGSFALRGVPAGTYELDAWHEVYGRSTQTITVAAGAASEAAFAFRP